MDILKKVFPLSFGIYDNKKLLTNIIIYVVAAIVLFVVGSLMGILFGWLPILGDILGIVFYVLGFYPLIGIVLALLARCAIIK